MKGIAHFSIGIAAASCFPAAVRAGADGNPLYFILGGIFGLLPDTMDFKFYRFFQKYDIEVVPDPVDPDPQMIADAVALAANRAYETGKPVMLQLRTIQLGSNLWRSYEISFDVLRKRVSATIGPVVNTSGMPDETVARKGRDMATSPLLCDIKLDYEATTKINILDGPSFEMQRIADGRVTPRFIPWHREWSHSVVIGLVFALAAMLIWGTLAGIITFCAYTLHVFVDQLGFMGSAWLFPFRRARSEGMKVLHSDTPHLNLAAVWFSCLLIFWNLYAVTSWRVPHFNLARLVLYGAVIPAAAHLALRKAFEGGGHSDSTSRIKAAPKAGQP
jgi:membrane-bound metal-dependent hydrolase YbcI (DUF457 family)